MQLVGHQNSLLGQTKNFNINRDVSVDSFLECCVDEIFELSMVITCIKQYMCIHIMHLVFVILAHVQSNHRYDFPLLNGSQLIICLSC